MCVICFSNNLSTEYMDGLPEVFRSAMQDLYNGKITAEDLHGPLVNHIAKELWAGVSIGFDTNLDAHSPSSDHYKLIRDFEENVFVFSGFKTYNQLREASILLFDDAGKTKPFNQFLKDVLIINKTYNINYLKAEYDNAIVSGQMATKWQSFDDDAMLKFRATIDDNTTEICHSLNGLVKPKSWPGWKRYWLPLHWGERSNIIETVDDATSEHEDDLQNPKPMFDGNIALDGVIFPDTHPYYDVCGGKTRVAKNMSCITKKLLIERQAEAAIPISDNISQLRKDAKIYALSHYKGIQKPFQQIANPVEINRNGIEHIASFGTGETFKYKLNALLNLETILQRASYSHIEPDRANRSNMIIHILKSYYGKHDLELVIKNPSEKAYVYDIRVKQKRTSD